MEPVELVKVISLAEEGGAFTDFAGGNGYPGLGSTSGGGGSYGVSGQPNYGAGGDQSEGGDNGGIIFSF